MTSEGLGEMFEGDSASVDGGPSGGSQETWERGPPSALAELYSLYSLVVVCQFECVSYVSIFLQGSLSK